MTDLFVSKKIPYTLKWDRMPVDISFVFENEKPAGKHGFLTVKNGDFFKIGIPFTFAAVVPAYIYIWLMYGFN